MIPGLKNIGNRAIYDDPQLKANEFNEYFAKVGENAFKKSQEGYENATLDVNTNTADNPLEHIPLFRPQPVDVDTVILVFKDLKETKSFGSDGIPLKFLKDALPVIILYIVVIINTSIVTGIYPYL